MNKIATSIVLALGLSIVSVTAQDASPSPSPSGQPLHKREHKGSGKEGDLHLLPPRVEEQLNLTPVQKQQIEALQAETNAKLRTILTPEQLEKLKELKHQHEHGGAEKAQ